MLRRVVEAAAAAVLGVNVLRQPPAEARAEEARLELERRVDEVRGRGEDRGGALAVGPRGARQLGAWRRREAQPRGFGLGRGRHGRPPAPVYPVKQPLGRRA